MKKVLAMLLALLMLATLAACGGKPAAEPDSKPTPTPSASNTPAPTPTPDTEPAPSSEPDEPGPDDVAPDQIAPQDPWSAFMTLVETYDGFEIGYSRTDWRNVYAGGKGNMCWLIERDENGDTVMYIGILEDHGDWQNYVYTIADGTVTCEEDWWSAIERITSEFAYYGQYEIDSDPRTPADVTNGGYDCSRYEYSFGTYAYDIAKEYGVTVRYSYIDDPDAGFDLDYIATGSQVEVPVIPTPLQPEADVNDPYYWSDNYGVNVCPFYIVKGEEETTYYFRGGGSFIQWLNTEMNSEGYYYYNDRVISRDGKWATEPDFDDAFSSFCSFEMEPYDGPTLSEAEQHEIRKGVVYGVHSWTPLKFASWYGIALDGDLAPAEDMEFSLTELRTDFADQEWINVYQQERLYPEEEEEFLAGHAVLYAFPHIDISLYCGEILEDDIPRALASSEYQMKTDPEAPDDSEPIFGLCIPNTYQGSDFSGDVDLIFTYDGLIAYYVVVNVHEAGWTP